MRRIRIRDWQSAELAAATWMRDFGYRDATASPGGSDAGIDVHASRALAQVKYRRSTTGRPDLQRLIGATHTQPQSTPDAVQHETPDLLFFTLSGYSDPAYAYAEHHQIALFTYTERGELSAANDLAWTIATGSRTGWLRRMLHRRHERRVRSLAEREAAAAQSTGDGLAVTPRRRGVGAALRWTGAHLDPRSHLGAWPVAAIAVAAIPAGVRYLTVVLATR